VFVIHAYIWTATHTSKNKQLIDMTKAAIQEQVDIIRAATQNATRSKEAAQKFLVDAGIIKHETKDAKKKKK
jgi:hypothetical protein